MGFAPPYARMRALLNTARQQMRDEAASDQPPEHAPAPIPVQQPKIEPVPEFTFNPVALEDRLPFPEYNRQMTNIQLAAIARQIGLDIPNKTKREILLALLDKTKTEWICP